MGHAPRSDGTAGGGLGRLIETEARLAEALATAEASATALLEAAKADAEAENARFQELLEVETVALAAAVAAERDAEIARIAGAAEERCRRLEELPEAVVEELATHLLEQILDGHAPRSRS